MDENPYAPPRGALHERGEIAPLSGWSSAQLRVLGWLGLAYVLGSLVVMLLSLPFGDDRIYAASYAQGLSLITVLLGSYLLLRLKHFLETLFDAKALGWPVWLNILLSLLLASAGLSFWGALQWSGWQSALYGLELIGYGATSIWLGVRLLGIPNAYRALRFMAWLLIAGGVMLVSLRLRLPVMLCLLGAWFAQAWVFFKGCTQASGRD